MVTTAFNEGKTAFNQNKELHENPYPSESQEAVDWASGWLKADALENREYIGLGSSNTLHF